MSTLGVKLPPRRVPVEARIWQKIDQTESCWLWTAARGGGGYGIISVDGHMRPAHRVLYELVVGPIPEGLQLDHLCRVRHCVNPGHLEPVTARENTLRGDTIPARCSARSHCINGHAFTEANTYRTREGWRACRACWSVRQVRYRAERKAG